MQRRSFVLLGAALASVALARYARPTHLVADQLSALDLEKAVPTKFGQWEIDTHVPVVLPSPDLQASLDRIYSQVLARTYRDADGNSLMLSLAYGRNQTDAVQIHKPEGCYGGQGFALSPVNVAKLSIGDRDFPVRRLVATKHARIEPITYWTLIGDTIAAKSWQEKVRQIEYAVNRQIPDGLLFRMSSIDGDRERAYQLHVRFAKDLIKSLPADVVQRIIGKKSVF